MSGCFVSAPEKGIGFHGTTVKDDFELPCRCWEWTQDLLDSSQCSTGEIQIQTFPSEIFLFTQELELETHFLGQNINDCGLKKIFKKEHAYYQELPSI